MAKLSAMAFALLVGAGLWAGPAMAQSNGDAGIGDIERNGGQNPAEGTLGDKGLKFTSDGFELTVTTRVQFRMTYQNEVANGSTGTNGRDFINFRVSRAKTGFAGFIFEKNLQYRVLLNWNGMGGGTVVENAVFTWAWRNELNVNAGQDKLNWNWEEYTSSGRQAFVERGYVNEVFNQDYAKGIWVNGQVGEETPWLKYWFGIYNGVLAGNNDFRNADGGARTEQFSNAVDGDLMVNLRLETHPMGGVKQSMYDDRSAEERDKILFAVGLGFNWLVSRFNDNALRPDTVGTPTASGRFRTGQDTMALTLDGHFRWMGLSVDIAYFWRHTEFHNFGRTDFRPTTPQKNGISNLTDSAITFEVGYFIIAQELHVGFRYNMLNADDFWGGSDNRDLGIRPDTTEMGVVVNYLIHGENLKLTFDILYVDQQLTYSGSTTGILGVYNAPPVRSGAPSGNAENGDHNALWLVRLQLQWIF
ncbi:MAG: hypothetical protein KF754_11600 [Planctomycetes bacterium]|nr:hypothetical protein [Planctomycetota bacterium]